MIGRERSVLSVVLTEADFRGFFLRISAVNI